MPTLPVSAQPWLRMYENPAEPIDIASAPTQGTIPAALRGIHYRVGPAGGQAYGQPLQNAFAEADGFVCAYAFTDDGVAIHGKIVETSVYKRERAAGRLLHSTFGTVPKMPLPLRLSTAVRAAASIAFGNREPTVKDSPNHVPCVVGNKLLLIGGAGAPFAMRASDLANLGPETFGGALPQRQIYLIGESHVDPLSGERCFLELCTFPIGIRLWSIGSSGRARGSRRIDLPHVYLSHDFGLTKTKIIFPAGPIYANIPKLFAAMMGIGTTADAFEWHGSENTRYFVIDRRTLDVRVYECPASYPVHVASAFDDGDDVVLYMNIHSDDACIRGFTASLGYPREHPDFRNRLHRIRLAATGKLSIEELLPFDCEYPKAIESPEGRPVRFVYACATARGIAGSNRIVKVDTETKAFEVHDYGARCVVTEPVFVPDPSGSAEDDGWILCQVYDSDRNVTFLSIIDAKHLENEVGRVCVPRALPYLLHGEFANTGG